MMQNANQTAMNNTTQTSGMSTQHGGHEMFDTHEALGGMIGLLDHYLIYDSHAKDPELKSIIRRQYQFITDIYNSTVQAFKTNQDPEKPTQQYEMKQNNNFTPGMQASGQPKKPHQNTSEINDECVSSYMLGQLKGLASMMTMGAAEMTSPVLRRVVADSIPNVIEMAYELFLYQNKHQYYQVPELSSQDTTQMLNSYTEAASTQMPAQQQTAGAGQQTTNRPNPFLQ